MLFFSVDAVLSSTTIFEVFTHASTLSIFRSINCEIAAP